MVTGIGLGTVIWRLPHAHWRIAGGKVSRVLESSAVNTDVEAYAAFNRKKVNAG